MVQNEDEVKKNIKLDVLTSTLSLSTSALCFGLWCSPPGSSVSLEQLRCVHCHWANFYKASLIMPALCSENHHSFQTSMNSSDQLSGTSKIQPGPPAPPTHLLPFICKGSSLSYRHTLPQHLAILCAGSLHSKHQNLSSAPGQDLSSL